METFSILAICVGNSPVTGEFPSQRPVTRSFDVFFDLSLNKRLSKQSWGWWFETLSWPLWRHGNALMHCFKEMITHHFSRPPLKGYRLMKFFLVADILSAVDDLEMQRPRASVVMLLSQFAHISPFSFHSRSSGCAGGKHYPKWSSLYLELSSKILIFQVVKSF